MVYVAETMKACHVKPELECYDIGMINNAKVLGELGSIERPLYFQFVLGVLGCIPATFDNLIHMVRSIPRRKSLVRLCSWVGGISNGDHGQIS